MTEYVECLCSTCRYSTKCVLKKDPSPGIQFCEEYETGDSPERRRKKGIFPAAPGLAGRYPQGIGEQAVRTTLGLCSNCAHRKGCGFPKPESGVWHCEEYR